MDKRAKWRFYKKTQRAIPIQPCSRCGATSGVHRHHPDYRRALIVVFLCQRCHNAQDRLEGRRIQKKKRRCAVCPKWFFPNHSKNHKTCSPACLSEIGRRNAYKRWRSEPIVCARSATPSSQRRQLSRSDFSLGERAV